MRKLWSIAFVFLAACQTGDTPPEGDEHPDDELPAITGMIDSDMTITGSHRFDGQTLITSKATVTVAPGAELVFAQGAGITVDGRLIVEAAPDTIIRGRVAEGGTTWGPIIVNGILSLSYVDFTGGQITTNGPAAQAIINDSRMYRANGDYIIMNGGKLDMKYSQLGPNPGEMDTTHCNLHINAAASISVLRNNISGAPYGVMFYGGVGSNFQTNNWFGASVKDIDTKSGVDGNFSGSWFEKGAPTPGPGATLVLDNLAAERITQAGPRL